MMNNPRKLEHLEREHYEMLLQIENGADIFGFVDARILREIEATEPSFVRIVDAQGEYDGAGKLPYFGAITTPTGLHFAKRRLKAMDKAEATA